MVTKALKNMRFRKMRGGGTVDCPPGVFCMSGVLGNILIVILIVFLLFMIYHIYKIYSGGSHYAPSFLGGSNIVQHVMNPSMPSASSPTIIVNGDGDGDDRYKMAPKPLRWWRAPPDPGTWNPTTLPSVSTRGLPESFQTIGLLKYPGGDLKPLYGRRTAGSNDRWNYYTRTDTYNPVPLPLRQGRRDCMEDTGCQEVFDGDKLKSLNGEEVGITLYKMNGPTYIPAI
jgi:hypothetical protein